MSICLDNPTYILYVLRDCEPHGIEEARHMPAFNGKVVEAVSRSAAILAIRKLRKRGQVERIGSAIPAQYRITSDGFERLVRLGLCEQVDTKALLNSFRGEEHGKA